jgi:hypothetical protein
MPQDQTPPSPPMPDEDALLEQARHEAQERVAELQLKRAR